MHKNDESSQHFIVYFSGVLFQNQPTLLGFMLVSNMFWGGYPQRIVVRSYRKSPSSRYRPLLDLVISLPASAGDHFVGWELGFQDVESIVSKFLPVHIAGKKCPEMYVPNTT